MQQRSDVAKSDTCPSQCPFVSLAFDLEVLKLLF